MFANENTIKGSISGKGDVETNFDTTSEILQLILIGDWYSKLIVF